jgi:HPt (histidine-containing phosphotransfer) domain-containing protein
MSTLDSLDASALERLRELGGNQFVGQMIGLFLELARRKLPEARAAEGRQDYEAVRQAVHPLRSSSGNVGAGTMMDLATRIDEMAMRGEVDGIPTLLGELELEFARVEPRLESERKRCLA